ncbi:MAG: hypothetical protein Q8907_02990, partial [Bacteroidota bacterium]|nr:hypothetical protein [Bacteroidota bacterium]
MFFLVYFLCSNAGLSQSLVSMKDGKLSYTFYANQSETNAVNIIPDFSFVGYMEGKVPLPDVPVVKTVEPVSGECHQVLQAAIDEVSALPADKNGIRGAVLLK